MPEHKDLTGADLHEPKGVDSATAGMVYIADGLGSGTWTLTGDSVHGEMLITNNTTPEVTPTAADSTLNTDTDYAKVITGWSSGHVDGGVVFSTDELILPYDGEYEVAAWFSIQCPSNNQTIGIKYAINDSAPYSLQKLIGTASSANHIINMAGHAFVTLSALDTLSIYIASTLAGDPTILEGGMIVKLVEQT